MWSSDSRRVAGISGGWHRHCQHRRRALDTVPLGEGQVFDAAWSPDSTQFAVGRADPDGNLNSSWSTPQTGEQKLLLHFDGYQGMSGGFNGISWSPDGQLILLTHTPPRLAPGAGTRV